MYTIAFLVHLGMKETILHIRITKEQKEELKRVALKNKRNLSDYLRLLIGEVIEKEKIDK